jgi:uncharacterized protein (TIGR03118 family)
MSTPSQPRQRLFRPSVEPLEERCLLTGGYTQVNLASDVPGEARVLDSLLVNPWGASFSPTGPFWFADNGSGVSDLRDGRGQIVPLVVEAGGSPTGTVFNGGSGFVVSEGGLSSPSRFLFATEDGTILGWAGDLDLTHALVAVDNSASGAVYKGLALAHDAGRSFLYAADFSRGTIDVFDQAFQPVAHTGAFQDPSLPAGFAPFNIQNINNHLFVTYARQDGARHDEVAGTGQGFIDVYDTGGNLLRRFASGGALDAPWGLALAPRAFGPFGGDLLVGNVGDGRISAYNPASGAFLGQLLDAKGSPIAIPTLWSLTFGNGHAGGDSGTLFFTAGLDYETHGLFGAIQSPQKRGADTAGAGAFNPHAPGEPGDYPLPPRDGPAFRASSADQPLPAADLLPLRESSLVLAPTLSMPTQSSHRADGSVPTQAGRGVSTSVVALHTFLDVNASPAVTPKKAVAPRLSPDQATADSRHSVRAGRAVGAEYIPAEREISNRESRPGQEPDSEVVFLSGGEDAVYAGIPTPAQPETAGDGALHDRGADTPPVGRWLKWMNLLVVGAVHVSWAYWLRHRIGSRQQCQSERTCTGWGTKY